MIKFYLKLQNKLLTRNILYYLILMSIIFNIAIRIKPELFININQYKMFPMNDLKIIPIELFTYCDVYLLLIFIITILLLIGSDFNNSMSDITLVAGGSVINKFAFRKFYSIALIYIPIYICTYINIYTIFTGLVTNSGNASFVPLIELCFYSSTTNIFIISLSMFILFIVNDTIISTVIIISYYYIEEFLWRCKVTQEYGILSHLYHYQYYDMSNVIKIKVYYIIASIVFLILIYNISSRKIGINLKKLLINK